MLWAFCCRFFLPGPSPLSLPCYFCWIPWCLRAAAAPVSHPLDGKNWTSQFLRSLVTRRDRAGLDHMKCASTTCQKSTVLAGNKSCSGSHKFFVLAAGDFCVLLITKIWLMPSCSCCGAVLKGGWPFFTDIPCTHGVCLLSLGSFVPVMFCFSAKLEKAKWFLFSYSKARQDCGVVFNLARVQLCSKIGLLSLAMGSIFQPRFLKHDDDV